MKREIKFRGKRIDNGEWVYGYLNIDKHGLHEIRWVQNNFNHSANVHPESVGQFTGLKDKKGKQIYDGDVTACYDWGKNNPFIKNDSIGWDIDENGWNFNSNWVEDRYDFRKAISFCEIIGNIYEHPSLLQC